MHIDISVTRSQGKVYRRVLLRTSYREGKKVKHKTIANLSQESEETIEAIRIALKNKSDIHKLLAAAVDVPQLMKGPSIGAIYVLTEVAKRLSVTASLGNTWNGKLALWQVLARVIAQGSRLSAVRLAGGHAVFDLLKLDAFTEDDLYENLDWLSEKQTEIERKLFDEKLESRKSEVNLFLYDVTSSYTEGDKNEYCAFGYNRDQKKGKKQIVIGLLTDCDGDPVSVQVFSGNRSDSTTVLEQIHKIREDFGVEKMIFVGDRGMIKGPQIDAMDENCKYITALTKPQMKSLIKEEIIKLEDFSSELKEIVDEKTGLRYVLRKNPVRKREIEEQRLSKVQSLEEQVRKENLYLRGHPKAKAENAIKRIKKQAVKLSVDKWTIVKISEDRIVLTLNEEKVLEESLLDGCYIIKTNVADSAETRAALVHERYKDLSNVEWAFRTMKTTQLEVRPYYVRKCSRTDGHVFVIMLAYKLIQYLSMAWKQIDVTVEEGIALLANYHTLLRGENASCQYIPCADPKTQELLTALKITLPEVLPYKKVDVATRKKLVGERKVH